MATLPEFHPDIFTFGALDIDYTPATMTGNTKQKLRVFRGAPQGLDYVAGTPYGGQNYDHSGKYRPRPCLIVFQLSEFTTSNAVSVVSAYSNVSTRRIEYQLLCRGWNVIYAQVTEATLTTGPGANHPDVDNPKYYEENGGASAQTDFALKDAIHVIQWVRENAKFDVVTGKGLGIDPEQIVVSGTSAGGTCALWLCGPERSGVLGDSGGPFTESDDSQFAHSTKPNGCLAYISPADWNIWDPTTPVLGQGAAVSAVSDIPGTTIDSMHPPYVDLISPAQFIDRKDSFPICVTYSVPHISSKYTEPYEQLETASHTSLSGSVFKYILNNRCTFFLTGENGAFLAGAPGLLEDEMLMDDQLDDGSEMVQGVVETVTGWFEKKKNRRLNRVVPHDAVLAIPNAGGASDSGIVWLPTDRSWVCVAAPDPNRRSHVDVYPVITEIFQAPLYDDFSIAYNKGGLSTTTWQKQYTAIDEPHGAYTQVTIDNETDTDFEFVFDSAATVSANIDATERILVRAGKTRILRYTNSGVIEARSIWARKVTAGSSGTCYVDIEYGNRMTLVELLPDSDGMSQAPDLNNDLGITWPCMPRDEYNSYEQGPGLSWPPSRPFRMYGTGGLWARQNRDENVYLRVVEY